MKRFAFVWVIALLLGWSAVQAEEMIIEEGKQYEEASSAVSKSPLVQELLAKANGKVQFIEFFSYACGWCFTLDPRIEKWVKASPDYVTFQRIPVEFQPSWKALSKAYYTTIDLNALDSIHPALFEAIQSEALNDSSTASLRAFFVSKGVKEQAFTKTFDSFEVNRQQKWANSISKAYRITAVPAFIVQGPLGIFQTSVKLAGSEENLIAVLDHLVKMQHEAAKTKAKNTQ